MVSVQWWEWFLSGFHWRWGSPSKRLISSLNTNHRSCPIANKTDKKCEGEELVLSWQPSKREPVHCSANKNCSNLACVLSRIRVLVILIVWTMVLWSVLKCLCALNWLHFMREAVPDQRGMEEKTVSGRCVRVVGLSGTVYVCFV